MRKRSVQAPGQALSIRAMLYFTSSLVRDCSSCRNCGSGGQPELIQVTGAEVVAMRRFSSSAGRAAGCIARGSPWPRGLATPTVFHLAEPHFRRGNELIDAVMQFARHAQTLRFLRSMMRRARAAVLLRLFAFGDISGNTNEANGSASLFLISEVPSEIGNSVPSFLRFRSSPVQEPPRVCRKICSQSPGDSSANKENPVSFQDFLLAIAVGFNETLIDKGEAVFAVGNTNEITSALNCVGQQPNCSSVRCAR